MTEPLIVPNGGWRYIQPDTDFMFKADLLGELVDAVKSHREANGLALGDPRQDILDQLQDSMIHA